MARRRDEAAFQHKKEEIRAVAEALFAERGFHQTGIDAICDGVGMSPGALYRYYPSRTDIIRDIVEHDRIESAQMRGQYWGKLRTITMYALRVPLANPQYMIA